MKIKTQSMYAKITILVFIISLLVMATLYMIPSAYADSATSVEGGMLYTYDVTYKANDGTFSNGTDTNVVSYEKFVDANAWSETRYSHTANIADDGTQSGNYGNNLRQKDVVTIDGAESLHISLTYQTQATYDVVYVIPGAYDGDITTYSGSYGQVAKLSGTTKTTVEYDIEGDTVTFGFYSNASTVNYGYYAVVTAGADESYTNITSGQYEFPVSFFERLFSPPRIVLVIPFPVPFSTNNGS